MQWISFAVIWKRIKALKYFMKDKKVSFWKKLLVVGGVLYLIMPIDLIPAPVLIVGFLDDLVLWLFILNYLKDELDKYWIGDTVKEKGQETIDPKKDLRGKTIIDGTAEDVDDESDDAKPDKENMT